MNQHFWWYVARGSGIVAWALVSASVVFGLWVSLRLTRKRPKPAWVLDVHRFLGALSVVFVGVHLAGLVADSYVDFGLRELFVPFASSTWKSVPVAWGVIGLYLLVAIETTSLLMRKLPRKLWRGIHMTSYAVFALSTVHMFAAGTDGGNVALQWSAAGVGGVVLFLTAVRILAGKGGGAAPRTIVVARAKSNGTGDEPALVGSASSLS